MKFRAPTVRDGATVFELIERVGALERNTCYAYLLLCTDFRDTCVIAEDAGEVVGFAIAYRPPARQDEVFVWQVGVVSKARGTGLGGRLLEAVLAAPGSRGARYLTATVSPDNAASLALFRGVARRHGVPIEIGPGFPAGLFVVPHQSEDFVRIGPLVARKKDHA